MLCYLALCLTMFIAPSTGLFLFFGVVVPLLPILFFVAPGLWRNICPLAAANQTPRVLGFSRPLTPPEWLRRRGYLIAMCCSSASPVPGWRCSTATPGPPACCCRSPIVKRVRRLASSFKGKSGWCSSICPLLPLQRVYGQTPFVTVPNSHCQPCVACTKNCYDFKPQAAYQADLHDPDPHGARPESCSSARYPASCWAFSPSSATTA